MDKESVDDGVVEGRDARKMKREGEGNEHK